MTSKLRLIFIFGSISLSVQRQVRHDNLKAQQDIEDLLRLIGNLNPEPHSHADEHHNDAHNHQEKDHTNLMNIQTLNMYYKNKGNKRVDSERGEKSPNHEVQSRHEPNGEVDNLLNELERELEKDEDENGNIKRCGCGRVGIDKTLRCRPCSKRAKRNKPVQRCVGNRCGRDYDRVANEDSDGVNGDTDVSDDVSGEKSRNDRSEYRCRGNRCGRSKVEKNNDLNSLQANSASGKRYKINDDLDAIVLDLSDLDGLLNKVGNCKDGKCRENGEVLNDKQNLAVVENVDLNNLIDTVNSHDNVEAIFIDLSQVENSDDVANYIKNKFSSNAKSKQKLVKSEDLFNYYSSLKKEVIDLILSYMQGDVTVNKLNILPRNVKQRVYNLKQQLQGVAVSENQLRNEINRIVFDKSDTKVKPHGEKNNNIYIPKWLHTAIITAKNNYNLRAPKSMFPLTSKQREKLKNKSDHRTTKPDEVGIPFELNVQGLGQVTP